MTTSWDLDNVGTLTGSMRIALDKTNGGTAADTAHVTPDQIKAFVDAIPVMSPAPTAGKLLVADGSGGLDDATVSATGASLDSLHVPANLQVDSSATVDDALTVAGAAQFDSTLNVDGVLTAGTDVEVTGTLNAATGLTVGGAAVATSASLTSHTGNTSNPHSVTAAQVGALPTLSATTGRVAVIGTSGTTITQGTRLAADLVEGPASAVASNLAGFNGTGGKTIQDSGVSAAYAFDSIAPTVQSAHTSSTRTLALSDLNQIIPLSAASNAIAVTIPHTLYAAAGSGRAFVCSLRAQSVAGGAITFAGSGGIVIAYHGKKPSTTAIVADDVIHVVVTSATSADVYISAVIP